MQHRGPLLTICHTSGSTVSHRLISVQGFSCKSTWWETETQTFVVKWEHFCKHGGFAGRRYLDGSGSANSGWVDATQCFGYGENPNGPWQLPLRGAALQEPSWPPAQRTGSVSRAGVWKRRCGSRFSEEPRRDLLGCCPRGCHHWAAHTWEAAVRGEDSWGASRRLTAEWRRSVGGSGAGWRCWPERRSAEQERWSQPAPSHHTDLTPQAGVEEEDC